jgi:hypothetical protein
MAAVRNGQERASHSSVTLHPMAQDRWFTVMVICLGSLTVALVAAALFLL